MDRWNTVWEHLRWVYERTDAAYTLAAAAWYEANEPWALAGITEKVRLGIESRTRGRQHDARPDNPSVPGPAGSRGRKRVSGT